MIQYSKDCAKLQNNHFYFTHRNKKVSLIIIKILTLFPNFSKNKFKTLLNTLRFFDFIEMKRNILFFCIKKTNKIMLLVFYNYLRLNVDF
jgi:hypothetical protein